LLARGEPAGYGKTVATTWALAFSRLEQDAPQAAGLLRLPACCAPMPVPLRLLLQASDFVPDTDVAQGLALFLADWLAARPRQPRLLDSPGRPARAITTGCE
jgi:hypothetical protein